MKNSHLMNVMLTELALLKPQREAPHLELGTRCALEKSMRSMVTEIDELNKSIASYAKYVSEKQKYDTIYNSLLQKRVGFFQSILLFCKQSFQQAENESRHARGEPLLSIEEIKKQLKCPQLQMKNGMLELFLNCRDIKAFVDYATTVTGDNIAKLFISETVSNAVDNVGATGNTEKERNRS